MKTFCSSLQENIGRREGWGRHLSLQAPSILFHSSKEERKDTGRGNRDGQFVLLFSWRGQITGEGLLASITSTLSFLFPPSSCSSFLRPPLPFPPYFFLPFFYSSSSNSFIFLYLTNSSFFLTLPTS